MKRVLLLLTGIASLLTSYAQVPEDALRLSWLTFSGTARSQAIGGAVGALGGDISSLFTNPAGLGFFKTNELVLSPGVNFLTNKSDYRGTATSANKSSNFSLGTSGAVFGFADRFNEGRTNAFSIGITQLADFNSIVHYKGFNDYSSYSEQFLEEVRNNNADTNSVYDFPFTSGLAYYTYLIDTLQDNGGNVIGFKSLAPLATGVDQEKTVTSSGGITEIALGFATNKEDKLYLGGSLGIPIMSYKRTTTFRESDASNNPDNDFDFSEFTQNYSSKGVGVNVKLGVIFKPTDLLRLGIGLHTPSFFALNERSYASMTTNTENYPPSPGFVSVSTRDANYYGNDNSFKYSFVSPWKFLLSGAYVIGQSENVNSQKGFISADLEYVTYGSSRFSSQDYYNNDDDYYNSINDVVKQYYKGAFNFRVGGELKLNTLMARAGFGFYGNPYSDNAVKANRTNISGGLGYRDKGMFIDIAYTYQIKNDVDFPYRLEDKANTFAAIKGTGGNVALTVGLKF